MLKDCFNKTTLPPNLNRVARFSYRCTKVTAINLCQHKKHFCILLLLVLWYDLFYGLACSLGKEGSGMVFQGGIFLRLLHKRFADTKVKFCSW